MGLVIAFIAGGFAIANRQSAHNADDSLSKCGGLPSETVKEFNPEF